MEHVFHVKHVQRGPRTLPHSQTFVEQRTQRTSWPRSSPPRATAESTRSVSSSPAWRRRQEGDARRRRSPRAKRCRNEHADSRTRARHRDPSRHERPGAEEVWMRVRGRSRALFGAARSEGSCSRVSAASTKLIVCVSRETCAASVNATHEPPPALAGLRATNVGCPRRPRCLKDPLWRRGQSPGTDRCAAGKCRGRRPFAPPAGLPGPRIHGRCRGPVPLLRSPPVTTTQATPRWIRHVHASQAASTSRHKGLSPPRPRARSARQYRPERATGMTFIAWD